MNNTVIFPADPDNNTEAFLDALEEHSYSFDVAGFSATETHMVSISTDEGEWQADALVHTHQNGSVALQYIVVDGKQDSQPSEDTKQALARDYFTADVKQVETDVYVSA